MTVMQEVFRVPLFAERENVVALYAKRFPLTTAEYAQLRVWLTAMLEVVQAASPPSPSAPRCTCIEGCDALVATTSVNDCPAHGEPDTEDVP